MTPEAITLLLQDWKSGNKAALDALVPAVYHELRRIALARLRAERPDHTLQPTALIHEAYVRLIGHKQADWNGRAHFFGVASHIMREILIDHARKNQAAKRGGGEKLAFDEATWLAPERSDLLIALSEGLDELKKFDERKARLLELKYFGGLSGEEISEVLGISISTIIRESRLAEAWLQRYLTAGSV